MAKNRQVAIVGIGQSKHRGHRPDINQAELVREAVEDALRDSGLSLKDIDCVVHGDMELFEGIHQPDMWHTLGDGAFLKSGFRITTGGTTGATIACAADMVPVTIPCRNRRSTSDSTLRTRPISARIRQAAKFARSSIIRRPYRSAAAPQIGAKTAIASGTTAEKAETHSRRRTGSCTPSCSWMKNGANGIAKEKPAMEKNWESPTAVTLRRQVCMGNDYDG